MPSVSSFILKECCRLTIHWNRFAGSGPNDISSGRLLRVPLIACQWIFIDVSSLM